MTYMHTPPEDPGTYCKYCDSDPCMTADSLTPCKRRWFNCKQCGRHVDRKTEVCKPLAPNGGKCSTCDPVEDLSGVPQVILDLIRGMSDADRQFYIDAFKGAP